MAQSFKILSQIVPVATTLTDLYTVPGATQTSVSSVIICNQNAGTIVFRISVAIAGAADDPKQYLYYDLPLGGNDTFIATIGLSLATTDVVRVQSNTANVSFNITGCEVT